MHPKILILNTTLYDIFNRYICKLKRKRKDEKQMEKKAKPSHCKHYLNQEMWKRSRQKRKTKIMGTNRRKNKCSNDKNNKNKNNMRRTGRRIRRRRTSRKVQKEDVEKNKGGAEYSEVESLMFGIAEGAPRHLIQKPGIPMALFASSLELIFPAATRTNAVVGQVLGGLNTH